MSRNRVKAYRKIVKEEAERDGLNLKEVIGGIYLEEILDQVVIANYGHELVRQITDRIDRQSQEAVYDMFVASILEGEES